MLKWKKRRMWPIILEYTTSVFWSYSMAVVILLWLVGKFTAMPAYLYVPTLLPGWNGMILALTCLVQFIVSIFIDGRYEKGLGKFFYWMIWYPMFYWFINVSTTLVALPRALFKKKGTRAVWVSPDRGIKA